MIVESSDNLVEFPKQRVSDSRKTPKWHYKCAEGAKNLIVLNSDDIRLSEYEKQVNIDLYDGFVDTRDVSSIFNPMKAPEIEAAYKDMLNYPIEAKYFNLLVGEGSQRSFNYTVLSTNHEINTRRNQRLADRIYSYVQQAVEAESFNKAEVESEISNLAEAFKHDYREMEEIRANQLLEYVIKDNDLENTLISTHNDLNLQGEEILHFDNVNSRLTVERAVPKDIYTLLPSGSSSIQDSSIIIQKSYMTKAQVYDVFRDDLTSEEFKRVEELGVTDDGTGGSYVLTGIQEVDENGQSYFDYETNTSNLGESIRNNGDVRVLRIYWKSQRKAKILTTEEDNGDTYIELVDAKYEPNADTGETVEDIWIDEWREAHQIGCDIYTRMGPWFGNLYSMEDLRLTTSPYVGYIYTVSGQRAEAPMSKIKNLKYLYNIIRHEALHAIGANVGNVAEIDLASVPDKDGWDMDKYLSFIKLARLKFVDSFKTAPEDPGVRAGAYNTTGSVKDMGQVNHIQMYDMILDNIKMEIGEILGITQQRLGAVNNRETKGGIERSVVQSSNTTEPWFKARDKFKKDIYTNSIELSKIVYDDKSVFIQNNADDVTKGYIELNGSEISMHDYAIFVSNSRKDTEIKDVIKQSVQPLFQTGAIDFSALISVMSSDDPNFMQRIIKESEINKQRQQKELQEQQGQLQREAQEFEMTKESNKYDFELTKQSNQIEADILIRDMENANNMDVQQMKNDVVGDDTEEKAHKRSIDERKQALLEETQRRQIELQQKKIELDKQKLNKQSNQSK